MTHKGSYWAHGNSSMQQAAPRLLDAAQREVEFYYGLGRMTHRAPLRSCALLAILKGCDELSKVLWGCAHQALIHPHLGLAKLLCLRMRLAVRALCFYAVFKYFGSGSSFATQLRRSLTSSAGFEGMHGPEQARGGTHLLHND
jgi:hypothetical protein